VAHNAVVDSVALVSCCGMITNRCLDEVRRCSEKTMGNIVGEVRTDTQGSHGRERPLELMVETIKTMDFNQTLRTLKYHVASLHSLVSGVNAMHRCPSCF
jgi:hypothetical protein